MTPEEAAETLWLIQGGLPYHSDALRDEAIRVVLAEVERLERMEESHREQGLVPSEWLTRAESAEARVKDLEAKIAEAYHVGDVLSAALDEGTATKVLTLRIEELKQQVERLRVDVKAHEATAGEILGDSARKTTENEQLRAALDCYRNALLGVDVSSGVPDYVRRNIAAHLAEGAALAQPEVSQRNVERMIAAEASLLEPEAAPKTHYKCKGCDRSGPLDYVAYSFVIQPEAAPKEER